MQTSHTNEDMSAREVANLFEIYGAVDQQVEANLSREHRNQISRVLPAYRRSDTHWFADFAKSMRLADIAEIKDPQSRVRAALTRMAAVKPTGRLRARRLFALAVVAHVFPEIPAEQLAAALGPKELPKTADKEELAALLRSIPESDTQRGRDEWWERLRQSELTPDDIGPRPCSGSLAWVNVGGDRHLVPTLKTVFDAQIEFEHARQFCDDPTTWECFPSWCDMKPINKMKWTDDVSEYQEVVSFDCNTKAFPKLTINLKFSTKEDVFTDEDGIGRRRVLTEYWLSDGQPEKYVEVNQGWLEIVELSGDSSPKVRVTTTKSVKFADELGGPGLASVSCRVGYMSMVGDLITCASKAKRKKEYPEETGDPDVPDRAEKPAAQSTAQRPDIKFGGLAALMVDETGAAVEECIDEYLTASRASYAKLDSGYTADDLVQDTADAWLRMLRQGARLTDVGRRVGRTAPGAGDRGAR